MRHGFLLINKPVGPTSHDVVGTVRRVLSEPKIGHLGTLDPAAEGLLVLAVGAKALKVVELFGALSKEYIAGVKLGAVSTTYDREGVIEELEAKPGWEIPDLVTLRRVIEEKLTGRIDQVPPGYSAVKIGGERAYRKMRQGREVNIPARQVEISECAVLSYEFPDVVLRVRCGSGTYIRSLAHDLGILLHCGGYLSSLKRTKVGEWSIENAVAPADAHWTAVTPLKEVLTVLPRVDLTDAQAEDVRHGRAIAGCVERDSIGWHEGLPIAVLTPVTVDTSRARKVF